MKLGSAEEEVSIVVLFNTSTKNAFVLNSNFPGTRVRCASAFARLHSHARSMRRFPPVAWVVSGFVSFSLSRGVSCATLGDCTLL